DIRPSPEAVFGQYVAVFAAIAERAEFLAEPELGNHPAGKLCRLLDVVGRAGREIVRTEYQFLRYTAAEKDGEFRLKLLACEAVPIALRKRQCRAHRSAVGDNGHFVQRIVSGHVHGYKSVARLVEGRR